MNTIIEWLLGSNKGDFAGGADWRIDFIGEYNAYVKFALVLVLVAMVYLTIRSYLREGDTKRKIKLTLAGLRIAVIVLAFLVMFRPAVVLRYTRTLYSHVLVLVDDSLSMSFKDRYSQPKDADRLANGLGVDKAKLPDLSRLDILRLAENKSGVFEKLAKDHPMDFYAFSTNQPGREAYTRRLGPTIEDALADGKKPLQPTSGPANMQAMMKMPKGLGYETNLPAALREAIDSLQGKRASIVVLSDCRMTTEGAGNRLSGAREYAAQMGYPLYSVLVGDTIPPKNIAVVGLQAPRDVRLDSTVQFSAKLQHRGMAGQTVTVKLLRRASDKTDWAEVKAEPVKFDEVEGTDAEHSRGEQTVELTADAKEKGEFVYRASVEARSDEQSPEDNAADAIVKVTDAEIKVLLVSGGPGMEFQFLKNYLLSQPKLYKISVWQENADPEVNQAASNGMKLNQLPRTVEELLGGENTKLPGYDAIILYDPQPAQNGFDKLFVDSLKEVVQKHNVGLCYIAGSKWTWRTLGQKNEFDSMRDLVPVTVANVPDMPELVMEKKVDSWPVRVTSYGLDHPIMRLGANTEQTSKLWDGMPGIYWSHVLQRVKPAARILIENGNDARRMERQAEPLLVTHMFGKGRVVYLNTDETWRWRQLSDAKLYWAFWSNVMKYLTPSVARQVVITTGGDRFSAGEKIHVEVEAYDSSFQPLKDPTYTITMVSKPTDGQAPSKQEIVCEALPDKPGRYKGVITQNMTTHLGVYELTDPKIAGDKVEPKVFRIELPQAEAERPEADAVVCEAVASNPEFSLNVADLGRLAELVPSGKLPAVRDVPRELWDSRLTLILIVTLLTIEWIVRKKYNMA